MVAGFGKNLVVTSLVCKYFPLLVGIGTENLALALYCYAAVLVSTSLHSVSSFDGTAH